MDKRIKKKPTHNKAFDVSLVKTFDFYIHINEMFVSSIKHLKTGRRKASTVRQHVKTMNKLKEISVLILFIIIGIPLFILAIPLMIIAFPIGNLQRKKFEKKYAEFLNENNGKNFFCYNNRKKSIQFIEKEIVPNLNNEIEIVFLNGKKIESEYNSEFISSALYKLKNYNKFPHLMKIRNGKLIDKSINNPFYGVLNMNKSKNELLTEIRLFFELNNIKNVA